MICGLLKPRTGVINFNGHIPFDRDVSFLNDIMIVPEEFDMPKVTLQEYADINSCFYPRFNRDHLERNITILDIAPDINLGQCSMGQKRKRSLLSPSHANTSLLLLDEPTNGLDISSKRTFRKAVTASMTDDKTFIISTHQVHDVDAILDHVTIIDRGSSSQHESIGNIAENCGSVSQTILPESPAPYWPSTPRESQHHRVCHSRQQGDFRESRITVRTRRIPPGNSGAARSQFLKQL